jgi:hypothetical protein
LVIMWSRDKNKNFQVLALHELRKREHEISM